MLFFLIEFDKLHSNDSIGNELSCSKLFSKGLKS